jgi:hypothetical protein
MTFGWQERFYSLLLSIFICHLNSRFIFHFPPPCKVFVACLLYVKWKYVFRFIYTLSLNNLFIPLPQRLSQYLFFHTSSSTLAIFHLTFFAKLFFLLLLLQDEEVGKKKFEEGISAYWWWKMMFVLREKSRKWLKMIRRVSVIVMNETSWIKFSFLLIVNW